VNPKIISSKSDSPSEVFPDYSRWPDIVRSWFWRYYDHLGHLLIYNFLWFLMVFAIAWIGWHNGWIGSLEKLNPVGLYGLYLIECIVSVGWAYIVFRMFNGCESSLKDYWPGTKKYIWKALFVSAISGGIVGLALFNIRFYISLMNRFHIIHFLLAGLVLWILLFWLSTMLYQWPILFFQNPSLWKIFYRSALLVLGNSGVSFTIFLFFILSFSLSILAPVAWFFIGFVYFFSFQCVTLEKNFLKYKITYEDKQLDSFLESLDQERKRGWRDFLRPWENR
jgi:hypothetical protein